MCHFQGGLSLELLKLFHMFSVLLSRPQRDFLLSLYAKHCSKSHCKKDALPKSSHSTKTLGLYQIFLNLPKALSTVILHFVRLLFFFFSLQSKYFWKDFISRGKRRQRGFPRRKELQLYMLFGPLMLEKIKVPQNLNIINY